MISKLKKILPENHSYTVVCIDDETDILRIQSALVQSLGLKVFAASKPAEAIAYIKDHQHEVVLVLSDFKMPHLTGFDVRKQLLEIAPAIPFVIVSAHVDREMALQGIDLKISAFLEKPFHLQNLTDLIDKEVIPRVDSLKDEEEMLVGFSGEAEELILNSEQSILDLEKNPAALTALFGYIHTLKGASSFFHPKTLHQFTHRYEDYLKKLQKAEAAITPNFVSALLEGLDLIKKLMNDLTLHHSREFDAEKEIERVFANASHPADAAAIPVPGSDTKSNPSHEKVNEIKIPLTTLDEFMQISGEMTVIRNMLNKCVRTIEKRYAGDKDVSTLTELLQELHKINAGVQNKISDLRKVAIHHTFKPLTRGARDVAKALQKEIDLQFVGEDLTIDTSIAELLSKILFHLLKNSIDHGIEMPADRLANGKPGKGTVVIQASLQNDHVVIEIQDDGRGIHEAALKKKALQNNLYTAEQLESMSKDEVLHLIFESGLSTAAAVTDVSGRGVGMSMVKSTVEEINGRIEIQSTATVGTQFKIILPVPQSLLITDCLFLTCGGHHFGIQQKEIFRVIRLDESNQDLVLPIGEAKMLQLEGDLIPVLSLAQLLGIRTSPLSANLIVIQSPTHRKKIALFVDELHDIEDTVVKPVLPHVNSQQIYLGATFLDDGTAGLILDASGLLLKANCEAEKKVSRSAEAKNEADLQEVSKRETLLLVTLAGSSAYAIPQESVFRIEKLSRNCMQECGSETWVRYRGKALPLIDLNQKLIGTPSPSEELLTLIMVNTSTGLIALKVSAVNGFVETDACDERNSFHPLCLGTTLVEDQIITVIRVESLVSPGETKPLSLAA